jgi:hypothetical protein
MELDATSQVDSILQNYQAAQLIIWITLGVIVVAVIALGSEFWVNLWGIIAYPSVTFQRMLGEAQTVPGIVIVAVAGMASAAIILAYFSNEVIIEKLLELSDPNRNPQVQMLAEQLDNLFEQIGSDVSITGNIDYIQEFTFQTRSIAVALPVAFLVLWFLWGLAAQLASMIAGNKAGHGLTNMWAALPYVFLVFIPLNWFSMLQLYGHGWARFMEMLFNLWFLFLHVVLMREHGRYTIGKAIVATIITLILVPIFIVVLAIAIAFIMVQVENYL